MPRQARLIVQGLPRHMVQRYGCVSLAKAKMVSQPQDYEWSIYRSMIGGSKCPWLDLSPCFIDLVTDEDQRVQGYRKFVEGTESAEMQHRL
jgi:hypothetical protein